MNGRRLGRPCHPLGYRALEQIAFEPDELSAVGDAAARVRALGDPLLTADVESAMRKFRLSTCPANAMRSGADEYVLTDPIDEKCFVVLGAALPRSEGRVFRLSRDVH